MNGGFTTPGNGGGDSGYGNCGYGGTGGDGYYGGGEAGGDDNPTAQGGGGGGGGSFIAHHSLVGSDETPPPTPLSYFHWYKDTGLLGTHAAPEQEAAAPGNVNDPDRCRNAPADCYRAYGAIPQLGEPGVNDTEAGSDGVVVVHFLGPRAVFKDPGDTCFYVPTGVSTVTLKAWGAGGARNSRVVSADGGGGGYSTITVSNLTQEVPLCLHVGSPGQSTTGSPIGGGESSYVVRGLLQSGTHVCQSATCELLLVAGGGGAAGGLGSQGGVAAGGAGGGQAGVPGTDHPSHSGSGGGGGVWTPPTGGSGGLGGDLNGLDGTYIEAHPGTFNPDTGGQGSTGKSEGGGGYWGGGGGGYGTGFVGGAGGGSGYYVSTGANGSTEAGNGSTSANIDDIDYRYPAGQGEVGGAAGAFAGLVVISW